MLLEVAGVVMHQRLALGFGVDGDQGRGGELLTYQARGAPGIDQVVDDEQALAIALDALEHLHVTLPGVIIAGQAKGIDPAHLQLAGEDGTGHEAAAGDADQPAPTTATGITEQLPGQIAGVAVELIPAEAVFFYIGHIAPELLACHRAADCAAWAGARASRRGIGRSLSLWSSRLEINCTMSAQTALPLLSIILPVRDEALLITSALQRLQGLRQSGVEVLVVDGGSRDDTVQRARPWADHVLSTEPGRAWQMNAGAAWARGEWLLFLHVDTELPEDAAAWLAGLKARSCDWGFFPVRLSGRHPLLRCVERGMNLRSRLTRVATGDQALFVRRARFMALGGFPDIPLMEDVALSKRLRREDVPGIWPSPARCSSRRWERHGVLRTILLMWWLRLAYVLGRSPAALHRQYYGGRRHD